MDCEECVVSGGMARLLRMAALCGCSSLQLQPLGTTYYIARITKPKYRHTIIFLCVLIFTIICCAMSLYNFFNNSTIVTKQNKLFIFLCVDITSKLFITIVMKFDELRRMKRFLQYYKSLKTVHETLNKVNIGNRHDETSAKSYESAITFFITVYIGWNIINLLFLFIYRSAYINVLLVYLYFFTTSLQVYFFLITSQILLMITITNSALLELNHALTEFLSGLDKIDNVNSLEGWKHLEIFYKLTDSYVLILDIVRKIKRNEGCLFLILLLQSCLALLRLLYRYLQNVTEDSDASLYAYNNAVLATSIAIVITKNFLTIDPCHRTQQAVNDTKVIVGSLMCKMLSSNTFSQDLKQFSKQLLFEPAAYSILNICTIDRFLFSKIMAAMITNLVTVIQI